MSLEQKKNVVASIYLNKILDSRPNECCRYVIWTLLFFFVFIFIPFSVRILESAETANRCREYIIIRIQVPLTSKIFRWGKRN